MRAIRAIVAAVSLGLVVACSGGDGTPPLARTALLRIGIDGQSIALFDASHGALGHCNAELPLNGRLVFDFGGPVDAGSLPVGDASGSITIREGNDGPFAVGVFSVGDDTSLPPGNARRVIFTPSLPSNPAAPTDGGVLSGTVYTVKLNGASGPAVVVAGQPLTDVVSTCFTTCGPTGFACYEDPVPGNPAIIMTEPDSAETPPLATSSVTTVRLMVSEALDPTNVSVSSVRVISLANGAQVPGTVVLYAPTTFPLPAGIPDTASLIEFLPNDALPGGATYRIEVDPSITDLVGNPIESAPNNPTALRRFETLPVALSSRTYEERFTDTVHRGDVTGEIAWNGDGAALGLYVESLVGDGSDGAVVFAFGHHDIDTGFGFAASPCASPVAPGLNASILSLPNGVLNATSFTVLAGATVRVFGPYPLHIRCLGTVDIQGTLDVSGFRRDEPECYAKLKAATGSLNNGALTSLTSVTGGNGGPGGGAGGDASQEGAERTLQGQSGFGPYVEGVATDASTRNDLYGGGEGGRSNDIAAGVGLFGGQGGAGGSAFTAGEDALPREAVHSSVIALQFCGSPIVPPSLPPALASGPTAAFTPPIGALLGGSGGGGGGDRLDAISAGVVADEQGGAGGGGGGGLRISALGDVIVGPAARIDARGGQGSTGLLFTGAGGSGSGGLVWIQSFAQVSVQSSSDLWIHGGDYPVGTVYCTGVPGRGGAGYVQIEDSDGVANVSASNTLIPFSTHPVPPANSFGVLPFPSSDEVSGTATSLWIDTGYGLPRYLTACFDGDLGDAPNGAIQVMLQAAHESVVAPGTPDLASVTPWIPTSAIDAGATADPLDGYRFFRFMVETAFAPPPASSAQNVLPSVTRVSVTYEVP